VAQALRRDAAPRLGIVLAGAIEHGETAPLRQGVDNGFEAFADTAARHADEAHAPHQFAAAEVFDAQHALDLVAQRREGVGQQARFGGRGPPHAPRALCAQRRSSTFSSTRRVSRLARVE
jgi:hypothetical protein